MEASGSVVITLQGNTFGFDHIKYKGGEIDARLSVLRAKPDDILKALDYDPTRMFQYHISAMSLSNVTAYRRELEKFHGNDIDWGVLLHEALLQAKRLHSSEVRSLDPEPEQEQELIYMVGGVFPENAVSIVFGMGGSGKSLAVESAVAASSGGATWAYRDTRAGNTLWLDYESDGPGDFARRRNGLAQGGVSFYPGSIRWMPGNGVPLPDLVDSLRREMESFHCANLVVDSVLYACGGNPNDPETATQFYNGLHRLPQSTKILIAHTDKQENNKYPFGSIMWHNGIHGMSWFVAGESEGNDLNMGWYGRKASNGRQQDFAVKYVFEDGAIFMERGDLRSLRDASGGTPEWARIKDALMGGEMGATEISSATGIPVGNVSAWLNKLQKRGEVTKRPDHKWGILYDDESSN